jgi:arsenate reductase
MTANANRRTVLFLCTGNSARSILAESLLNHMGAKEGGGRFRAVSAGSQPKGRPHPMALEVLRANGLPAEGFSSKSWHEFAGPNADPIDLIITVCDNAAGESCPVWPGRPVAAHWGIEDPAAVEGKGQRAAFERALGYLHNRISLLLALPDEGIDALALNSIGQSEGASEAAARD